MNLGCREEVARHIYVGASSICDALLLYVEAKKCEWLEANQKCDILFKKVNEFPAVPKSNYPWCCWWKVKIFMRVFEHHNDKLGDCCIDPGLALININCSGNNRRLYIDLPAPCSSNNFATCYYSNEKGQRALSCSVVAFSSHSSNSKFNN